MNKKTPDKITDIGKALYRRFLTQIQSYNFQREVFENGHFLKRFADDANGSTKSDEVLLGIHNSITFKKASVNNEDLFDRPDFLEMEGAKPEAMADFLNALLKTGTESIEIPAQIGIDQRLSIISTKMGLLRTKAKKNLDSLIGQLALARRMNIKNNNTMHSFKYILCNK